MISRILRRAALAVGAVMTLVSGQASAQDRAMAFTGATIHTMAGPVIENGTLVIEAGRIVAVGADGAVPADAEIRDASGMVIMPGIVDTHSHIGSVAGADRSSPIQPEVRAMDAINPKDASIAKARAGGVTTANVMPGSGWLVSGQTFYMRLRDGDTIEDIAWYFPDGAVMGGLKMANGTNPIGSTPGFPGTRAKSAALARAAFTEAESYCKGDRKKVDLGKETLCEVLSGRRLVHFHTHRADDIMTVLRLQREFGFKVLIQHGMESWKVAEELAAAGIPVSNIIVDSPGGKLEAMESRLETAGILERAGVLTSLHSDDGIIDSRLMFRQAGIAVRGGMSREGALRALTINGAKQLGLDDRVGSLEPGKDADFLILDGDPLSVYTDLMETWVEGQKLFDRTTEEGKLLAEGGYGAGNPMELAHHHWEVAEAEAAQ
ncbi:amidohydrolase family protein [Erythrobacter sp.]|uniref:amidohydrolase family protein n=1 Tax=Erythrobacter sp. TaxID=1042 RepID=UPI001B2880DC|nr:amidohydrolase family protein [Erythrobacter sp.]MBO6527752.1 amidohydrolase family protein [Erythrobacter sp.]MBO6529967.1 amidohydrolase family protein [Erythrobacter sp.]